MPTFLSDPPQTLYLVLGGIVIVTAAIAAKRQDRRSLVALGIALAVALLVLLVDRQIETPREESVRRIQEMAHAADTRNREAFVAHMAETVEYHGPGTVVKLTREEIRNRGFWDLLHRHNVHVAAWDFSRDDVKEIDRDTVEVGFLAKGEAEGKPYPVYIRATFGRQSDGTFRLTRFGTYDPMKRTNEPIAIFGFP